MTDRRMGQVRFVMNMHPEIIVSPLFIKSIILAWDHLAMFVEENVPDCFDSNHLAFVRQKQMNRRIWAFIQEGMDAKEIKAYYEGTNPQDFNLTSRIAYRMIFLCPWLLKAAYPIYRVYK